MHILQNSNKDHRRFKIIRYLNTKIYFKYLDTINPLCQKKYISSHIFHWLILISRKFL